MESENLRKMDGKPIRNLWTSSEEPFDTTNTNHNVKRDPAAIAVECYIMQIDVVNI
jgi:hypothetical protein